MPTTVGEGILGSCTAEPLKCICVRGKKDRKGRERERDERREGVDSHQNVSTDIPYSQQHNTRGASPRERR
jgi:hypothetical protein